MRLVSCFRLFVFYFILFYFFFHILALEDQLQQAKQHAEQYKSMSEANESALSDLNKVGNKRKVFSRILEKYSTRKASLYYFLTWKISVVIFIGEGLALSLFKNLITCSPHYDILSETRSRMATATTFSRQNDVGLRKSTT